MQGVKRNIFTLFVIIISIFSLFVVVASSKTYYAEDARIRVYAEVRQAFSTKDHPRMESVTVEVTLRYRRAKGSFGNYFSNDFNYDDGIGKNEKVILTFYPNSAGVIEGWIKGDNWYNHKMDYTTQTPIFFKRIWVLEIKVSINRRYAHDMDKIATSKELITFNYPGDSESYFVQFYNGKSEKAGLMYVSLTYVR